MFWHLSGGQGGRRDCRFEKITVSKVRVIRDGTQIEIQSQDLVPGDICFIEEGVKIPADGLVVESMNLEVNESVLTGESMPVPKMLQDEIFSGTIAAKGRGITASKRNGYADEIWKDCTKFIGY